MRQIKILLGLSRPPKSHVDPWCPLFEQIRVGYNELPCSA